MKTILLIEDDEFIRDNTAEILGLAGYAVQPAENGRIGIALALATRPDLVLCDIMMPVLDGYGVLAMFTQNPQLAGVPFIFLTAKTELTDLRRGMELGADDYLTKPFDQATLLRAVASRLHRFQHLKPDYALSADGLPHLLPPAQQVYLEGDEATRVYFVQAGRIKTLKTTAGGKELITGLYGPGEFFGYLTLLEGTPHRDSAVAVDDSELIYIPQDDFSQLLLRNREVSQQFIRLLAGRVSEREQQLLEMAYSSIRRRVADVLVRLHEEAPATDIHLSRDDMAALIGMAPESLIRTLSEFRQSGFIELPPNTIRVVHLDKLRQAAW
jgi:CRP-like cAMP-binding protein